MWKLSCGLRSHILNLPRRRGLKTERGPWLGKMLWLTLTPKAVFLAEGGNLEKRRCEMKSLGAKQNPQRFQAHRQTAPSLIHADARLIKWLLAAPLTSKGKQVAG